MTRADRFLSAREVARMMRVSAATVWRYTKRGTLPEPIKIDGHTWWIEAEILAVIASKKASRNSPAPLVPAPTMKKRIRVRLEAA